MYKPTQGNKGIMALQKLATAISSITDTKVYPPRVKNRVLQELLLLAFKADRGAVAACTDVIWALKDLATFCGQNSFLTRAGQLIEGIQPDYTKASEVANWLSEELDLEVTFTEEDFPSFDSWLEQEAYFKATH